MRLRVVPMELAEANACVTAWHRHHQPCIGHRFSLGVIDEAGGVHGIAVVGRPVARMAGKPRAVAEVIRVSTDGTQNACSMLYGAAARAASALGFERIQTYTLPEEGGISLRASGWVCEGEAGGGDWNVPSRGGRRVDQPQGVKWRWVKRLHQDHPTTLTFPTIASEIEQQDLFGDAA